MKKVYILIKGEANNVSYERTYQVFSDYKKAKSKVVEELTLILQDEDYSLDEILNEIDNPSCDSEGNDVWSICDDEVFYSIVEGEVVD